MTMSVADANSHYDVAIIGLGPVGATLANLLGGCGTKVVVLEKETDIYALPRAVHFDDEVLRIFQTIGLAEQVLENSPFNPGMQFINDDGDLLLDWPRPTGIGEHQWQTSFHFHQPDLESVLRKGIQRFEQVRVVKPANVTVVIPHEDHVSLCYKTGHDTETLTADYVVGCDGAHSMLRQCMDVTVNDLGFRERWLVIDVLLKVDKPELGFCTVQYCTPDRPATYVRGPGNRRRWEISVKTSESESDVTSHDTVWRLLQKWVTPDDAEIERVAVYTFHSMIATNWRTGRLFIAGDAAHQMPPFMGQGMCAGIRDASNLGWKLHSCISAGKADEVLLDSYQSERAPHVMHYIQTAIRLGGLINACDTEEGLRLAFTSKGDSAEMKSITPLLGDGMVNDKRPGFNSDYTGTLAPQPLLASNTRLDDAVGYRFVLLVDARLHHKLPDLSSDISVVDSSHGDIEDLLRRYHCQAVLIRPDRYILGTATNEAEIESLICFATRHALLVAPLDKRL